MSIRVSSPDFDNYGDIPPSYTCWYDPAKPITLNWTAVPNARSYIVMILDITIVKYQFPDLSLYDSLDYVHWIAYNIFDTTITTKYNLYTALNSENNNQFIPPCPPIGEGAHKYAFYVYALDIVLPNYYINLNLEIIWKKVEDYVINSGVLIAFFER